MFLKPNSARSLEWRRPAWGQAPVRRLLRTWGDAVAELGYRGGQGLATFHRWSWNEPGQRRDVARQTRCQRCLTLLRQATGEGAIS